MRKKSIVIMIGLLLLMIGTSNKATILGAFTQGQKSIVEYIVLSITKTFAVTGLSVLKIYSLLYSGIS